MHRMRIGIAGGVALCLAWLVALAFFSLGSYFLGLPRSGLLPFMGLGMLIVFPGVFQALRLRMPDAKLTVWIAALVAGMLLLFFDLRNGGWVSTEGADSGNHWMIYWDLVTTDPSVYSGFTAFHWGVDFWRQIFPTCSGLFAVAMTQVIAVGVALFFFAFWGLEQILSWDLLIFSATAASLRVLTGDGYYSQVLLWPFFWAALWFLKVFPLGVLQIGAVGIGLVALRGVYGGDLPFFLVAWGAYLLWVKSAKPWVRVVGLGALAGGAVGLYQLLALMPEEGGFRGYGTHEALVLLALGGVGALFLRRVKTPQAQVWRNFVVIAALYLGGVFLWLRAQNYYLLKILLLSVLVLLAGRRFIEEEIPRRFLKLWRVVWVLAWALVFQRYVVLMVLWFVAPLKPTIALPHQSHEHWMKQILAERGCDSYLYVTGAWARYNWTNHVLHRNLPVTAHQRDFLSNLETTQENIPARCVFIERSTDQNAKKPRITTAWSCIDSGIASVGEICAAPKK